MSGREQAGFSLVEIVVALGLTAGVLLATAGLFATGARQVRSARSASEALAAGRRILEDMNGWAFEQIWLRFDPSGTFGTTTYIVDTSANDTAFCTTWRTALHAKLGGTARATVRIESLARSGAAPNLSAGPRNVRVTVTVFWTEMARSRSVTVGTVRM